jgi:molybdate transport repressor ModE-like protein
MSRRSYRVTVHHKVWLETAGGFVLGDGGIELLRAVDRTGSLRGAAIQLGWSYRHVLRYLSNAEAGLGADLVARARGGHDRGGARLTRAGRDLLRRYTAFRRRLDRTLDRLSRAALRGPAR